MKKLAMMFVVLFSLYGCGSTHPKDPKIPVWTPPKVELPQRPKLVSDGNGTDGEIARKVSIDLYNMEEYAMKLENVCKPLQGASGVVPSPTAVSR